jgi:4,4'-diaponeurosporenoate glycosyltransferase
LPDEVICVDDASTDGTAAVAERFGVHLISVADKPDGWLGKSWACQTGASEAKGSLLLFLDADVRLHPDALSRLAAAYQQSGQTLSVQPYHEAIALYEQLSLIFNLVQIAANGTALKNPANLGLYGPVILIAKETYLEIGGHESVKDSIVEDMALGEELRNRNIPYSLYVGDSGLSFRMYPCGLGCLLQGWIKNLAAGASKTPPKLFIGVFLWIASAVSVPLHLFRAIAAQSWLSIAVYGVLYLCWVTAILFIMRRIGKFRVVAAPLYPLSLAAFLALFVVSIVKRLFGIQVHWKGRAIRPKR